MKYHITPEPVIASWQRDHWERNEDSFDPLPGLGSHQPGPASHPQGEETPVSRGREFFFSHLKKTQFWETSKEGD